MERDHVEWGIHELIALVDKAVVLINRDLPRWFCSGQSTRSYVPSSAIALTFLGFEISRAMVQSFARACPDEEISSTVDARSGDDSTFSKGSFMVAFEMPLP